MTPRVAQVAARPHHTPIFQQQGRVILPLLPPRRRYVQSHRYNKPVPPHPTSPRLALDLRLADLHASLAALLERGQTGLALRTLQLALAEADTTMMFGALAAMVRPLPLALQGENREWVLLCGQIFARSRNAEAILVLAAQIKATPALVLAYGPYLAWAYNHQCQHALALATAQNSIAHDPGHPDHGLAQRVQAEALAFLGLPGWQAAFLVARTHLQGRGLGLCLLEEGVQHERLGAGLVARRLWLEGLGYFGPDPYYNG
jgi:hypothetical protein